MQDREALVAWLTVLMRRMRLCIALRELAWAALIVASTAIVYQILAAVITAPAVMSALKALLFLFVIIIVGMLVVRGARPVSLKNAAAAADTRANLNDEIKTAYWFTERNEASPLVDVQIRRALRSAQKLVPEQLFSIGVSRIGFAAGALAIVGGWLAWTAPRLENTPPVRIETAAATSIKPSVDVRKIHASPSTAQFEPEDGKQDGTPGGAEEKWAKLEATMGSLGTSEEIRAALVAIKFPDAARTAQLLADIDSRREFAHGHSSNNAHATAPPASTDLIARLQELFSPSRNAPQAIEANAGDQLAVALSVAQKLDEDTRAHTNNPAHHTADEATNNPLQAAVPLERYGPRETRRSQSQGGEFAGTTDVEGGAMGRRVTQTTMGAGGKPSANDASENNNIEAESVLGKRTMRLAAQLEHVKISGAKSENDDAGSIAEGSYSATRAQQAQHEYQNVAQQSRYVSESAVSGERVPLAYRGAVKDYFLNLNRKEP